MALERESNVGWALPTLYVLVGSAHPTKAPSVTDLQRHRCLYLLTTHDWCRKALSADAA